MAKVILIQDPHHEYAARFIELIHAKYGYPAVCCFTDRKRRVYLSPDYPVLRSPAVLATCDVPRRDLRAFAKRVASVHEVVATIPFSEECLLSTAEMSAEIGLRWNDLPTVHRLQDKWALKEHVRRVAPAVRMNACSRVCDLEEIFEASMDLDRWVLKPNPGFANRNVGFFDRHSTRAEVGAFLERTRGMELILEEYVGGEEYFVNGQTNERGDAEAFVVFRYTRVAANGRENLDYQAHLVHRDDPVFERLVDYASRVVRATGLVRAPFHLEAKVDERGPCLIEVGARLAGLRNGFVCNAVHGGALDVLDVAAHYYLSDESYGPLPLRWDTYDSVEARYVSGVAAGGERLGDARSIESVEGLRSFHSWAKKPSPERKAPRTLCCLTIPWSVVLLGPRGGELDADEAHVRRALAGPGRGPSAVSTIERTKIVASKAGKRLAWLVERSLPALDDVASPTPRGLAGWIARRSRRRITRRNLVRKIQEAGLGLRYRGRVPVATPGDVEVARTMLDWARAYLTQPHAELGRKGAVCPFVAKTLAANGFLVAVHDEVDGDAAQMRDLVLSHAAAFQRKYPAAQYESSMCLLLVLPNVSPEAWAELDVVHDETKTYLMKRKMMIAAMHPRSRRAAINNSSFAVMRAPLPCFAVRHMVVQDIAFVGHNRAALLTYDRLFGGLFVQGKISNEFGYVDLYHAARERFGLPPRPARGT